MVEDPHKLLMSFVGGEKAWKGGRIYYCTINRFESIYCLKDFNHNPTFFVELVKQCLCMVAQVIPAKK